MPKLTDEQIVQALECCASVAIRCKFCPLNKVERCERELIKRVFVLINRLKAENAELNSDLKTTIENEKLVDYLDAEATINGDLYEDSKTAKTEAYKEFAERLKDVYDGFNENHERIYYKNLMRAIDDILKEMVGEG